MRRSLAPFAVLLALGGSFWISAAGRPSVPVLDVEDAEGFRVIYRVEDHAVRPVRITTEVVEVRRPYEARVEGRPGRPPGGRVTSGQVSNREFLWQLDVGGELQFGVRRIPAGPLRGTSLAALRDAARQGIVEAIGSAVILGRRCAWFVHANPAPQPLSRATDDGRVESCIDARGIVLMEVWHVGGRLARIIEAVGLGDGPPSRSRFLAGKDPATERVGQPEAAALLQRQFVVDDDADLTAPIRVRTPQGWKADRRAAASQATGGGSGATQIVAQTYLRGRELVVVELGAQPSLPPAWRVDEGETVELGELGEGRLVYYADRVELRLVGDLGFVRVAAPSRGVAVDFVRSLTQVDR
jgi:hypothetical protein